MTYRRFIPLMGFLLFYASVYIVLRSQHVIVNYSNVDIWPSWKGGTRHSISMRSRDTPIEKGLEVMFFPAMFAEQTLRNLSL